MCVKCKLFLKERIIVTVILKELFLKERMIDLVTVILKELFLKERILFE